MFYRDVNVQWTTSVVKALRGCSSGHDSAQVIFAHRILHAAGDRASRFRANCWPAAAWRGRARPLDRDAAAGEEST